MTAATPVLTAPTLFSLPCADPVWLSDADAPLIRRFTADAAGLSRALAHAAQHRGCIVLARYAATLDDLSGGWGGDAPAVIRDADCLARELAAM